MNLVMCKSRAILTRIIRSPYITNANSHHFGSPVERRLFEDVAAVSGNRCIKHGSSSTVVDWQTTVGVFFRDPDISKNTFRFPASPAINDMLSAYHPTSGTGSLNSVEIRCAVPEIFTRERKRVRSRRRGRSQEDDHSLTFDPNEFGVREPNSAKIGLAVLRNAPTDGHTDRHLCFMFIDIHRLECPAGHLPPRRRKTGWRHSPLKGKCCLSILQCGFYTFG